MKTYHSVVASMIAVMFLSGCVSTTSPQEEIEGTVLYETDFSAEDEVCSLSPGLELSDGTLKFVENNPHGEFNLRYGQDSITEFRLLRPTPETHAEVHLLHNHELGSCIYYGFMEDRIIVQVSYGGENLHERSMPFSMGHGEWRTVRIALFQGRTILSIDGEEIMNDPINEKLPKTGKFTPAAYESQMQIDDLRIVGFNPPDAAATAELPPLEGKIIYQTSFDREEGKFDYHRGMKIHDGILDFIEDSPGCNYNEPYGQDSITQFKLRILEGTDSAHISLLWEPDDGMRMLYIIESGLVSLGIAVHGEHVYHEETAAPVLPGKWHTVRIELRRGTTRLWLDGDQYIEAPIPEGLPEKAWFFPLAHDSRMQMDDLIIAELPREEAVAEVRPESPTEALKPLNRSDFSGRRIAVVGIKTENTNLEAALASFVTNALVNMNIGRIVERNDVEQIINEYSFQASDITDESTAVEIGKLLGADIIAIGSLYQVGTIDYLNLKLIEVETGEIVASSMASSTVEEEYLRMCNEAVKLIGD